MPLKMMSMIDWSVFWAVLLALFVWFKGPGIARAFFGSLRDLPQFFGMMKRHREDVVRARDLKEPWQ